MTDRRQEIRAFIVENFLFGQDNGLPDHASFLDQGIVDSTGVLELVGYLEKTYRIKVEDAELVPENFDSIQAIVSYLERKGAAAT